MNNADNHILIVDDHRDIREPLKDFMQRQGFRVSVAANGKEMDRIIEKSSVDLIVLDIMMPGQSGLEICRRIRETRDIPIILLTAKDDEIDRIVGLELGADDYVTKPFNPRELSARISGVLRRVNSIPKQFCDIDEGYIAFDGWVLNVNQQVLQKQGGDETVPLSTKEFQLLMVFASHPKIVLSRDQLLDMVSHRSRDVFDRTIDNQISRLRKKIELDPKEPMLIKTIWGSGYMFAADTIKT